jgi:hypothetical protein
VALARMQGRDMMRGHHGRHHGGPGGPRGEPRQ